MGCFRLHGKSLGSIPPSSSAWVSLLIEYISKCSMTTMGSQAGLDREPSSRGLHDMSPRWYTTSKSFVPARPSPCISVSPCNHQHTSRLIGERRCSLDTGYSIFPSLNTRVRSRGHQSASCTVWDLPVYASAILSSLVPRPSSFLSEHNMPCTKLYYI